MSIRDEIGNAKWAKQPITSLASLKTADFAAVCLQNGIPFSKSFLKTAICHKRPLYSSKYVRQEQMQGPPIPNPEEKVPKISQLAEITFSH